MIDDSWSQAHAITLVDFRKSGNLGLLTGKRFMAHNGHDPGEREPLGVYWYERANLRSQQPRRNRLSNGPNTSSITGAAPAAAFKFLWPIWTAMATSTSSSRARAACSCLRI